MADILVVDDDRSIATAFEQFLLYDGHAFRVASSAQEALGLLEARRPDLVVMDIRMPGMDGLEALPLMRERFPGLYVVIMTAHGSSQTSIDAIRAGAFDYLTKPLDLEELRDVIKRAVTAQRVSADADDGAEIAPNLAVALVGKTPGMLAVYKLIGRLATNSVPALVVGERGTGKRLVVRTIHQNSLRREGPLTHLTCGSVTTDEFEAAVVRGHGGTVLLEAIDQLARALQDRLARLLAEGRADVQISAVRPRILATTERDLAAEVREGQFSRELFDEVSLVSLSLPPLRARRDDLPLLVQHFLNRFNAELSRTVRGLDDQAMRLLAGHAWPGNVGELERALKRAAIVTRSEVITVEDLGDSLMEGRLPARTDVEASLQRVVRAALHDQLVQSGAAGEAPFHQIVDTVEATLVAEALTITGGNQVKAAEILGVNRATLRKKMPGVTGA